MEGEMIQTSCDLDQSTGQEEIVQLEPSEPEVCKFYLLGKCRFGDSCRNLHEGISQSTEKCQMPQAKAKPKFTSGSLEDEKKPPMKTASDVISRIVWDESLNADYFTVGYVDRFLGIIEKPFTMFDWGDLATADLNALAIPQHRISYFKYKHRKVWDKNERLDIMFGSTGCDTTITEFMSKVDTELESVQASAASSCMELEDAAVADSAVTARKKSRPNFFLALKIVDNDVISKVLAIHNQVKEVDFNLGEHFIPIELLHVTLALMQLDSEFAIAQALKVLRAAQVQFSHLLERELAVEVKGLNTFHNRLLCVNVSAPPALRQIVSEIKILFGMENVQLSQDHGLDKLHMTIFNSKHSHVGLPDCVTALDQDTCFGTQQVDSILLCSMSHAEMENGFYRIVGRLEFGT